MKRGLLITASLLLAGGAVWLLRHFQRPPALPPQPRTVEQVLKALGPRIAARLAPAFHHRGISYPPERMVLLAFKAERRMDLYAPDSTGGSRLVMSWPILALSGTAGPKVREGDRQVPEGIYRIELLNPNSMFHLSLRVNYPNPADLDRARQDGRDPKGLGGDIMIHGGAVSAGCLAMGDEAVEELFVLAAATGLDNIRLVIAPCDLGQSSAPGRPDGSPGGTPSLHEDLRKELRQY